MNRITNYIQKESNNVKLLLMLFLSLLVLTIATKGQFFSLNQMQLVAYLFPEMGVLALGMMLAMISGGIDLSRSDRHIKLYAAENDNAGRCIPGNTDIRIAGNFIVQSSDGSYLWYFYRISDCENRHTGYGSHAGRIGYYPGTGGGYHKRIFRKRAAAHFKRGCKLQSFRSDSKHNTYICGLCRGDCISAKQDRAGI